MAEKALGWGPYRKTRTPGGPDQPEPVTGDRYNDV